MSVIALVVEGHIDGLPGVGRQVYAFRCPRIINRIRLCPYRGETARTGVGGGDFHATYSIVSGRCKIVIEGELVVLAGLKHHGAADEPASLIPIGFKRTKIVKGAMCAAVVLGSIL